MRQVRLLKVIVQVVVAVDDGEQLEERAVDPVTVPAADWPAFAANGIQDGLKALQAQVEAEDAAGGNRPGPTTQA